MLIDVPREPELVSTVKTVTVTGFVQAYGYVIRTLVKVYLVYFGENGLRDGGVSQMGGVREAHGEVMFYNRNRLIDLVRDERRILIVFRVPS